MNHYQLMQKIKKAFKDIKLDNGIGLWEAQGLDDGVSQKECLKLRAKDEIQGWLNISATNLNKCSSSLSFFDAKGMRFHLPAFLLDALGYFEAHEEETYNYLDSDIEIYLITITNILKSKRANKNKMLAYFNEQFSLLSKPQIKSVIAFLQYRVKTLENYSKTFGVVPSVMKNSKDYNQLETLIKYWELKLENVQ